MRDWFATWPACTPTSTSTMPATSPASVGRAPAADVAGQRHDDRDENRAFGAAPVGQAADNGAEPALTAPSSPNVPAAVVP